KAGYPMCLDDLGAGAAAFQYLRSLQVDYVKIDGSYIRDMLKTSSGAAFVRAMTTLAVDLGMAAIAEMVEDAKTAEALYGMGVTYAQGYLYGRPNASFGAFTDLPRYAETQHGRGRR
ncbi:MAG: EAL domain-containing protein, partial [Alphaproteobacteria bacterium]|nr:EAL domain-containing protein [Alphaproteobacteria bacterium]